jgi:hypothetical protein
MSAQIVLLPVFISVGLTLVLLLRTARNRDRGAGAENSAGDIELQLLFYTLIALALPLRHADVVIVLLSWVFVVTRLAQAGILVTSSEARQPALAWHAGALVLFAMWIYFALRILLLI